MDPVIYQLGGEFSFDTRRRQLFRGSELVSLPSRAAQVLELLIASRDRVVPKEEITESVWNDVSVAENNLHQSITALRKAFGDTRRTSAFITTVPNVGYRFVAPVVVHAIPSHNRIRFAAAAAVITIAVAGWAYTITRPTRIVIPEFTNLQPAAEHEWLAYSIREFAIASLPPNTEVRDGARTSLQGSFAVLPGGRLRLKIDQQEREGAIEDFPEITASLVAAAMKSAPNRDSANPIPPTADPIARVRLLRRAVVADPKQAAAISALGAALNDLGHSSEAAVLHRKAVALSGDLEIQARHAASSGDWPAAIHAFTRLWTRQPERLESSLDLAAAQLGGRDAKGARSTLDNASRQMPQAANDPRFLLLSARIEGQFANMERVRHLAHQATDEARRQGLGWIEAKATLLESGASQNLGLPQAHPLRLRARALCDQLGDLSCLAATWRIEGNFELGAGKQKEAADSYWRALKLARQTGNSWERLNVLAGLTATLLKNGDYAKAETAYREALKEDLASMRTDSAGLRLGLAEALFQQGREAEAKAEATRAVQTAERAADKETTARAYLILGRIERKRELLSRSIKLFEQVGNPTLILMAQKELQNHSERFRSFH